MRKYVDILKDIANACNNVFFHGHKDIRAEVVESATKIYIAELEADSRNNEKDA